MSAFARTRSEIAKRVRQGARFAWPRLVEILLPDACPLCGNLSRNMRHGAARTGLCAACDAHYWNDTRIRCTVCAMPLARGRRLRTRSRYRCDACETKPPAFDATLALGDYRAPLDGLAQGLKFRARLAVGATFAERLAQHAEDALGPADLPDVLVPVPLSRARLIERGYNQAWQIARPLARELGARADATLVRRVLHTAPQAQLDRAARRHNLDRAFALTKPVRGLHVGVVDDVMTSGATLDALAHTLKTAGAQRVTNFVALRTPRD
jgi:ComF family protein